MISNSHAGQEAIEAFKQATSLAPSDPLPLHYLGWAYGLAGRRQEALSILEDLSRRSRESYVGGTVPSWVYLGLGDLDKAISWLEKAADERDGSMTGINIWPTYDPLRSDPRFQALLRKMNFPAQAQ